jgi:hypothetical protein
MKTPTTRIRTTPRKRTRSRAAAASAGVKSLVASPRTILHWIGHA